MVSTDTWKATVVNDLDGLLRVIADIHEISTTNRYVATDTAYLPQCIAE